MFTAPVRVGSRGQQTLSEVAGTKHLALTKSHVSEVIAGGTTLVAPEGLKLPIVDKSPLLHQLSIAVRLYCYRSEGVGSGFRLPL